MPPTVGPKTNNQKHFLEVRENLGYLDIAILGFGILKKLSSLIMPCFSPIHMETFSITIGTDYRSLVFLCVPIASHWNGLPFLSVPLRSNCVLRDLGSRIRDFGFWIRDLGSRIRDLGSRIRDLGSRI